MGMFSKDENTIKEFFLEKVLNQIKKYIPEAIKTFSEYMGDDEKMIIIRKIKGTKVPMFFIVNTKDIVDIKLKNIESQFSLTQGMEKIFSGEFKAEVKQLAAAKKTETKKK